MISLTNFGLVPQYYIRSDQANELTIPKPDAIRWLLLLTKQLFRCFSNIEMKGNSVKCHLSISSNDPSEIEIGNLLMRKSCCKIILILRRASKGFI